LLLIKVSICANHFNSKTQACDLHRNSLASKQNRGRVMKPAPFEYERPETLSAALNLLKNDDGKSKIIAGGQSLVPMMNFRVARPDRLIDINRIAELDYHRIEGSELVIGALCRHATLKDSVVIKQACPMMHAAYEWVAHGPIRNRGTLCGNLCHADPASEMPAVALAAEAVMVLRSSKAKRSVAAKQFFVGQYETATADDEILVEVRIPVPPRGGGWGFHEVNVRKGDFAIVAVAATMQIAKGNVQGVACAIAGVGSHAIPLPAAEKAVLGRTPDDAALRKAAAACAASVNPNSDMHASAAYRRDLTKTLVYRALSDARDRCS
jgi:aerobic carbon-monoxide dehydrogenase medium subunit